jgi:hypothetical protein
VVLAASATALPASATALPAASAATRASVERVVSYHGYQVTVPASWPVYNLATDPTRCVLFDQHAVYLGTPGAGQRCPARAYGRTDALLIQPSGASGTASAAPKSAVVLPQRTAALPASAALPAAAATTGSVSHEIQVEAPGPGVVVTATYGASQSRVRSILAGATMTTTSTSSPSTSSPSAAGSASAAASASAVASASAAASASAVASASAAKAASAGTSTPRELVGTTGSGLGFDACTAPSVSTMSAWLASPYRVIGTYLGGVNWACDYGNFTPDWVQQVSRQGWQFIPIWVGEQAPCSTIKGAALINPADAAAEGTAEAASAVSTAQSFGYGTGSPVYFDMEGYSTSAAGCSQAVLTFLSAWTQGLHAAGYQSGVYSSAGSGIVDLAREYGATTYNGGPYASPDDVWIADWDGNPVTSPDPYLPDTDWASGERLRQYAGGHNETWGGATINIDSDAIGGAVSTMPGAHLDAGPSLLDGPDAVTAPAGTPATVTLTLRGTPTTPAAETWRADPPAGVTVTPASGKVTVPPGHPVTLTLTLTPGASTAAGRYDVPVVISVGGKTIAETFEVVSVTPAGTALPTAHPVVLYAADTASMTAAESIAQADALPAADVTGNFDQAWTDLTGGKDLVIAVGQAAVNGLYYNACRWASPSGSTSGGTPFYYLGAPYRQSPGADIYEPADGTTDANSALLAAQLTHFALTGTLPGYGRPPTLLPRPADTCLGSASVPVP